MRSQQFSEGIFVFLMLGIALFSGIVFVLGFGKDRFRIKGARLGEMVIFGVIILGIIAAVIMAAMQMLGGYLF
jgi:hypothetical protein